MIFIDSSITDGRMNTHNLFKRTSQSKYLAKKIMLKLWSTDYNYTNSTVVSSNNRFYFGNKINHFKDGMKSQIELTENNLSQIRNEIENMNMSFSHCMKTSGKQIECSNGLAPETQTSIHKSTELLQWRLKWIWDKLRLTGKRHIIKMGHFD